MNNNSTDNQIKAPAYATMLVSKGAGEWIAENGNQPKPKSLWENMCYEGEASCLFADSGVGKSILAVQISHKLSLEGYKVLYCDLELTTQQFVARYTAKDDSTQHVEFSPNFVRCEIDPKGLALEDDEEFEQTLIKAIEFEATMNQADVVIVDNIMFMCNGAEKGELAGRLMRRLLELKRSKGFTMIVLAHTRKRLMSDPVTQNDLSGSKRIFNLFDSVFAIGKSNRGEQCRYLKQLKNRDDEITYGEHSVLQATIVKDGPMLHFELGDTIAEYKLLKPREDAQEDRDNRVMELHLQGMSIRKIAAELNTSKSVVEKALKRCLSSADTADTADSEDTTANAGEEVSHD